MDDDTHARMHFGHQIERMYGHIADIGPNPSSNEALLPQSPAVDGWENVSPLDISVPIRYHRVNIEEPPGVYLSSLSPIRDTPHLESLIISTQGEDLPVTPHSNSELMNQTTFITLWRLSQSARAPRSNVLNMLVPNTSLKSTLRGFEGPFPVSVTSNEVPREDIFSGVDTHCNWNQEGVSMDTPLHHGPQNTGAQSTFPGFYHPQTAARYQEQLELRERPQQSQIAEKGPTAKPPGSLPRPVQKHGAPRGIYWCSCGRSYTQERGLTRHERDNHGHSLCICCGTFKYHRRDELEKHLLEQHPDANISDILREVTKSRREATKIKKQQRDSLLVIEHTAGDCAETGHASSSSQAAVGGVASVFLHASSSVDYDPRPKSAKSTMKKRKREYVVQESSESATYGDIAFPPSKKLAQVEETNLYGSASRVQICAQNTGMLAYHGGSTAPTHPFNSQPAPIYTSTSPVDGYNGSQRLVHPNLLPSSSTSMGIPGTNLDHGQEWREPGRKY